jgi:BirA family biotin operon repressor/biotin-[acetyl-CoA-carboxylase] ligase
VSGEERIDAPRTAWLGQDRVLLDRVESTNRFAAAWLADARRGAKTGPSAGTAILAHEQTAGRGQYGTAWHQVPGEGLALTLVLFPGGLPAREAFRLNAAVALGALEALREGGPAPDLRLKWPNDLVWCPGGGEDWRKLGGILIENALAGARVAHSLVGIGLNLNQTGFPPELPNPASLRQRDGRHRRPGAVAAALCEAIEPRLEQLRAGAWGALKRAYLAALDGYGEPRRYRAGEETFTAVLAGVEDGGELALEHDGRLRRFAFKAVERVPPGA